MNFQSAALSTATRNAAAVGGCSRLLNLRRAKCAIVAFIGFHPLIVGAQGLDWFEIEPNSTCVTGTPFTVSSGLGGGQLSSASDVDSFQFGSSSSSLWTLTASPVNNTYDGGIVQIRTFDPQGHLLAGRGLTSDSDPITLLARANSGTYCVQVDQVPGYQIFTKDYLLSAAADTSAGAVASVEEEPNNSGATATLVTPSDGPVWSQLSSDTDLDYLRVDASADSDVVVSIDVENRNYDGSTAMAYLADGVNFLAGRQVNSDIPSALTLRARRLTAGPVYLLLTRVPSYIVMDKYVVSTIDLASPSGMIEVEPNNSKTTATTVLGPGQVTGQLYDSSDVDFFRVGLAAGVASFMVSPTNAVYDGGVVSFSVLNGSGTVLSSQQINSDSSPVTVNLGIAKDAYYYLRVDAVPDYQIFDKHYVVTLPTSQLIFVSGFEIQ